MKESIVQRKRSRRRGEFKVFNHPSKMANQKANELIRKFKKGKVLSVTTGNGKKRIKIAMLEDGYIYLLTEAGEKREGEMKKKCQRISVSNFKHACYEFIYLKTVTRNEFERFSKYWSSLFALLITTFLDVIKKCKTPKGSIRVTLLGSRVFFSGLQGASNMDWEHINKNGAAFILMAYPDIKHSNNWIRKLHQFNIDKITLDSGVFSVLMKIRAGEEAVYPCVYEYCDFIKKHKELLFSVINLDHLDPKIADENLRIIEKHTGIKPVPVWHPGDYILDHNWHRLDEMIQQDHAVIAIGKTVGRSEYYKKELFNELFRRYPNQNFHWLGGCSQLLIEHDFFSADSTSWYKGREPKRQVYVFEGFRKTTKLIDESVILKEEGLTFNIQMMQNLEYMQWPIFQRKANQAPFRELEEMWNKVYTAERAKKVSKSGNQHSPYQQLQLFEDEMVS